MNILRYMSETGASSPDPQPGFLPVYEGNPPQPTPCEQVVQAKVESIEGGYVQTYRTIAAPRYSAGDWLEMVGIGAGQQPTLIYLKLQLMAAGKKSDKLTALETYLNGILAAYAADPTPRCDWQLPPVDYQETVSECVELLKS